MKYISFHLVTCVLLISLFGACSNKDTQEPPEQEKGRQLKLTDQVVFLSQDNKEIATINVAIADEQEERNQGLMDVISLPSDAGMLFKFPEAQELSFYMANTPLPLDIMFVNNDSTIIRIHHNTTPFNSKQLLSDGPAQYVVETNAGYAISNDIQEGMKIRF